MTFRLWLILVVMVVLYGALAPHYCNYLTKRPVVERVGYVPPAEIVKFTVADQHTFVSSALVIKVLTYFGGITQTKKDASQGQQHAKPEYREMYRILEASINLDPYNTDAYYFAQAIIAWDTGQILAVNRMLEHGMQYRTWDWYLPFFLGFNHAFFLKDLKKAAGYYQRAGELSGNDLFMRLAGRYLYDVGETEQAVLYLAAMVKTAKSQAVRQNLELRLKALRSVLQIELACRAFSLKHPALVASPELLQRYGYLTSVPQDPYGGQFTISSGCKVSSSSGFYTKSLEDKNKQPGK